MGHRHQLIVAMQVRSRVDRLLHLVLLVGILFEEALARAALLHIDKEGPVRQEAANLVHIHGRLVVRPNRATAYVALFLAGHARGAQVVAAGLVTLNGVADSTEDQHALIRVSIRDHAHGMVADEVHPVAVEAVLDVDPHLLVQQEQMQVIQKRSDVHLAKVVVSATNNQNTVVHRQVGHRVSKSGTGRLSTTLDGHELTVHNLSVNSHGLEVAQLIAQKLAIAASTTEVVNTFKDLIALQDIKIRNLLF